MEKVLIFVALIVLSLTRLGSQNLTDKVYKNATIANEPALKLNSRILISTTRAPALHDFIAYDLKDSIPGTQRRIQRVVGMENDIIEIRDGVVYNNGKNIDEGKNLMHSYKIPKQDYLNIKRIEQIGNEFYAFPVGRDSVMAMLQDEIAVRYNWKAEKQISKKGVANPTIKKVFHDNWNEDNFGPLKIPKDKIFVIGDNRHNSEDSRFLGFIDRADIFGVVTAQE